MFPMEMEISEYEGKHKFCQGMSGGSTGGRDNEKNAGTDIDITSGPYGSGICGGFAERCISWRIFRRVLPEQSVDSQDIARENAAISGENMGK